MQQLKTGLHTRETLAQRPHGSEGELGEDRVNRTQMKNPLQVRAGECKESCKGASRVPGGSLADLLCDSGKVTNSLSFRIYICKTTF